MISLTGRMVCGVILALGIAGLGTGQALLQQAADAQGATVQAPRFVVDPLWPKPLPNNWLLGWTIGVWVDDQDYVWIIHRGASGLNKNEIGAEIDPPIAECCRTAPPVLEFDPAGNLVRAWGGPGQGYEWPQSNHGIHVDYKGNVWIGGNGEKDAQILKFTKHGNFLLQVGHFGGNAGSNNEENFGRPAKVWVDPKTNEVYVADGYKNKRVGVLDADSGKMKRYWGAYGNKPDDSNLGPYDPKAPPVAQFRNPVHCVERSNDGLVYVCDRQNDRLQVFQPDGQFVQEAFYAKNTRGSGSVWDITFSKDPEQRFIFLADGQNERVRVILRDTLEELTSFGDGGRQRGSSTASTASHQTPRAIFTRPRPMRESGCRSSSIWASNRSRAVIRSCSGRGGSSAQIEVSSLPVILRRSVHRFGFTRNPRLSRAGSTRADLAARAFARTSG